MDDKVVQTIRTRVWNKIRSELDFKSPKRKGRVSKKIRPKSRKLDGVCLQIDRKDDEFQRI